ncbi:PP2C family protein-serine/threonine phosphatase [Streptomyces sp. NPDC056672]|uniref:PP2C family protein-serine/threonine phosphatase n=1 Tax=Streptomyces sp. NPDC056672 TaxID=3345906 RepID=UPI003674AA22
MERLRRITSKYVLANRARIVAAAAATRSRVPSSAVAEQPFVLRLLWQAPKVLPVTVLCVVTVTGFLVPPEIHLASLLVAVPAMTAGLVGPGVTGVITAFACVAAVGLDIRDGLLNSAILPIHVIDLLVVCGLVLLFWFLRGLDTKAFDQVRSVSDTVQRAVLRPLPRRIGRLRIASVYRSAAAQAQIGGDLYAVAQIPGAVRLIIGDVRGHGLPAVDDATAVLGAFREAAHQTATLPELVASLEGSVRRHITEAGVADRDSGERFITVLVVEVPDDAHVVRMISCGHPPPLRSQGGTAEVLRSTRPAPPLGLAGSGEEYHLDIFRLAPGDVMLLHTDGLLEARDSTGTFYPASDRLAGLRWCDPDQLLELLMKDLLKHVDGQLQDDVALVAMERLRELTAQTKNLWRARNVPSAWTRRQPPAP